jgi:hypothetical protein
VIRVIFNGTGKEQRIPVSGWWGYAVHDNKILDGDKKEIVNTILAPYSCSILYQKD